jgi:hypothetical protein
MSATPSADATVQVAVAVAVTRLEFTPSTGANQCDWSALTVTVTDCPLNETAGVRRVAPAASAAPALAASAEVAVAVELPHAPAAQSVAMARAAESAAFCSCARSE